MADGNQLTGAGGKKSTEASEAPDSLHSIATARIVDVISEGPIKGLVTGDARSVFYDRTPVRNADGSDNFENFILDIRHGTVDQAHVPGQPGVENEVALAGGSGVELKYNEPFTQAITNPDLSAVRVKIYVPQLQRADSANNRLDGDRVVIRYELSTDDSAFVAVYEEAIDGKTRNGYERSTTIYLPEATTGWMLRATRLTPDATNSTQVNKTYLRSYTELINVKLAMPNTAYVANTIGADQFSSIPTRIYHTDLLLVEIPSNYDPIARTYTGIWDGTFVQAWTDNPVWCTRDFIVNDRYGCGHLVSAELPNKWALYKLSMHCDELVPNGKGGQEPRYRFSAYFQQQADAWKVINDMLGSFRAMQFWMGGTINVVGDMADDLFDIYTPADVKDGKFNTSSTGRAARHTAAYVTYFDEDDFSTQKIAYVEDADAIARFGFNETSVINIGCPSYSQAIRFGRSIIASEQFETEMISFVVGLEGKLVPPGAIIGVMRPQLMGERMGGRVSAATLTSITVDHMPITAPVAGDILNIVTPAGEVEKATVATVSGRTITVEAAFSAVPLAESTWVLERTNLRMRQYRVLDIDESEDSLEWTITALLHEPAKYAYIDALEPIVPAPTYAPQVPARPTGLEMDVRVIVEHATSQTVLAFSWSTVFGVQNYDVEYQFGQGPWNRIDRLTGTATDVYSAVPGPVRFRVRATNASGVSSPWSDPYAGTVPENMTPGGALAEALVDIDAAVSDNVISRSEKLAETVRWNGAISALSSDQSKATAAGVAHTDYTAAYTALQAYIDGLDPALTDMAHDTPVVGSTYRTAWNLYLTQRTLLLNAIADKARTTSTWSGVSGTGKPQDNADVTATAPAFTAVNVRMPGGTDVLVTANAAAADATAKANAARDAAVLAAANAASTLYATQARAAALQAQINDVVGTADDWVDDRDYPKGDSVRNNGILYRAKQPVPAGTPTSDTAYWENIGNYSSVGEAVAAAVDMSTTASTWVSSYGEQTRGVIARVPSGTGQLSTEAYALQTAQAQVSPESAVGQFMSTTGARLPDGNGKIASASSVDSVRSTVEVLKSPKSNGISDPYFQTSAWTNSWNHGYPIDGYFGRALLLPASSGLKWWAYDAPVSAGWGYTASIDAYRDNGSGQVFINVRYLDADKNHVAWGETFGLSAVAEWKRISHYEIAPAGAVWKRIFCETAETTGSAYFANPANKQGVDDSFSDDTLLRATTERVQSISVEVEDSKARIGNVETAIADEAGARAQAISNIQADYNGKLDTKASHTQLSEAVAGEASARSIAISALQGQVAGKADASIVNQAVIDIGVLKSPTANGVQDPYFQTSEWINATNHGQIVEGYYGRALLLPASAGLKWWHYDVPVNAGWGYTLSGEIYRDNTAGSAFFNVEYLDANRNHVAWGESFGNNTAARWARISHFEVPPAGAAYKRIYCETIDTTGTSYFNKLANKQGLDDSFSDDSAVMANLQQLNALNFAMGGVNGQVAHSQSITYKLGQLETSWGNFATAELPELATKAQAQQYASAVVAPDSAMATYINNLNLAVGGVNGAAVSSTSLTYRANTLEATKVEYQIVGGKVSGYRVGNNGAYSTFEIIADSIEMVTGSNTGVAITKNKMDRVFGNAAFYEGDPFGADNLVFWIGPKSIAKASATKANGTFWISSSGDRGGGAMIGSFSTSRASATSSTPNGTVEVSTGSFERSSSNAQITVSVGMFAFRTSSGSGTNSTAAQSVSGVIEKSVDGGAWTQVGGWSARGSYNVEYDSGIKSEVSEVSGGGYAADTTSGTNIAYRARRTGGGVNLVSSVANNMTISITVEQV